MLNQQANVGIPTVIRARESRQPITGCKVKLAVWKEDAAPSKLSDLDRALALSPICQGNTAPDPGQESQEVTGPWEVRFPPQEGAIFSISGLPTLRMERRQIGQKKDEG